MAYLKFPDYLEQYLRQEKLTPAGLARQIRFRGKALDEETVVGWLRGVEPGNQVMDQIEEVTGYRFNLCAYDAAYQEAALGWTSADRTRFPVLETIDTPEKLLALFRTPSARQWLMVSLSLFFGFPRHGGMHHFLSGKTVNRETYAKILDKLPNFLRTVADEAVSVYSPATVLITRLIETRRAHGQSRQDCARATGINAEALEAMESRQNDQTHFHKPEIPEKICRFLANSGVVVVEFGMQATPVVDPASVAPVTAPIQVDDIITQLRKYAASHGRTTEKALAREIGCNRRTVELWFRRGRKPTPEMVARIRELISASASEAPEPTAEPTRSDQLLAIQEELRGLQKRVIALERSSNPGQALTVGTFPKVRHIGEDEISSTQSAIREVRRLLNRCAALTDDAARARIRETLRTEVDELVITIIAFGREHPFALLTNLERMREWAGRFYEDKQQKG